MIEKKDEIFIILYIIKMSRCVLEKEQYIRLLDSGGAPITTVSGELSVSANITNSSLEVRTVTESARVVYTKTAVSSNTYAIMIPLDGNTGMYPHVNFNSISIDTFSAGVVFETGSALSIVKLGVITRISPTNCDIDWLISENLCSNTGRSSVLTYQNYHPSSVLFDSATSKSVTNDSETDVAAINTVTLIDSPGGSLYPKLGDVVIKLVYVEDIFDANVSVLYHSN